MSSADRFLAAAQRRRHRGVHFALAIGVGVLAACALSLIAGARRSASVVERIFDSAPKYDVRIFDTAGGLLTDDVQSLPGVDLAAPSNYIAFNLIGADVESANIDSSPADFSIADPTVRILRGHRPDGSDLFEVIVNQSLAENFSLDVGDRLPVVAFGTDQRDDIARGVYEPHGPEYEFTIAAVVRFPQEIALDENRSPRPAFTATENIMIVSVSFWSAHRAEMINFGSSFDVRLDGGQAGVAAFLTAVRGLMTNPDDLISEPWTVADNKSAFSEPVGLETSALLAVGVGAALITALLALLLVRLERRLLEDDYSVLRAIGITRRHLARTAILRVAPAAVAAGTIATAGAILLSDRFPIGIGRELEFHRGLQVDVVVVAGGALCVVAALVGGAALTARRAGVRSAQHASASVANLLGVGRLPLHASIGARLATDGRDRRRSSSIGATVATAIAATAVVIGVSTWLAGTAGLYDSPSAHGWQWDLAVGNVNFTLDEATLESVEHSPLVTAATSISYGQVTLDGLSTEVLAFDAAGSAPPATLHGRLPITASEVALGAALMRELNVAIGDTVTLSLYGSEFVAPDARGREVTLTVVGESISPVFGESDIADIGVVTLDAIAAANGDPAPRLILVDVVGPDISATVSALIAPLNAEVRSDLIPARIVNLQRVRSLPNVGRSLAVALGLIAITATLFAPARANRKKLAVLAALGLDRKGRRVVVGWQGVFTAAAVLFVGVPLGLILGAAWWRNVAADLGVRNTVSWAPGAVTITIAAALLGAIFAALLAVRRISVAATLRGE